MSRRIARLGGIIIIYHYYNADCKPLLGEQDVQKKQEGPSKEDNPVRKNKTNRKERKLKKKKKKNQQRIW